MNLRPKASSEAALHRMQAQGRRDTTLELKVRRILYERGYRYRVDYPVLEKPKRKADIVFTKTNVAVFLDGCFWHGCPKHGTWPKANAAFWRDKILANRARDEDTNRRLKDQGWKVIRAWEHENPEKVAEKIEKAVSSRQ